MVYEKLREGNREEIRPTGYPRLSIDAFRERSDPERVREALERRGGETEASYRRRLEGALETERGRVARRRRLLELCSEEVLSRVDVTDQRRHFFVLKEGEVEDEFEMLKGRCLGHRAWIRVHERHLNAVSVALTGRREIPELTPRWIEPISGERFRTLRKVYEKQEEVSKIWHLQYARQYHAKVIKRKRTPEDYFAEFRVWIWTRKPEDYPADLLESFVSLLEFRYGEGWVSHPNVRKSEPEELQVRDEVDLDEAEDQETVHFNVSFWKMSGGFRVMIGEYWGVIRKVAGDWQVREYGSRLGAR